MVACGLFSPWLLRTKVEFAVYERRLSMPTVNGKKYPYTEAGMAAAKRAKAKKRASAKKSSVSRKVNRRGK